LERTRSSSFYAADRKFLKKTTSNCLPSVKHLYVVNPTTAQMSDMTLVKKKQQQKQHTNK
jgi:hypothetical protein